MVAEVSADELGMRDLRVAGAGPYADLGTSPRSRRRSEHWPINANYSDPALASYHRLVKPPYGKLTCYSTDHCLFEYEYDM